MGLIDISGDYFPAQQNNSGFVRTEVLKWTGYGGLVMAGIEADGIGFGGRQGKD